MVKLSVVIPLFNEEKSLNELYRRIVAVCISHHISYEIWFVDDGSTDKSWNQIIELSKIDSKVKGIKFLKNYGKSRALHSAFKKVNGEIIITMDADLQDFPEEIPEMIEMIEKKDFDLVSGWKKMRFDNQLTKNLPSKLFNTVARKLSGIFIHDFNCGLKAYKKKVVKNINIQGDMHRYIPVLAKQAGFEKIGEKIVLHQPRIHGVSKFGTERFIRGFLDLITLWFVNKFATQPMHFFGLFGTLMFISGFLSASGIGINKLLMIFYYNEKARLVTDNPWFYISLVCMILGTQLFIAGFIGEIIVRTSQNKKKDYSIEAIIN